MICLGEVVRPVYGHRGPLLTKQDAGRFAVSGLSPYCAEIVRISQMGTLWAIYPTCEEAVAEISS